MKFGYNLPSGVWVAVLNRQKTRVLGQSQRMTLTSKIHKSSCTYKNNCTCKSPMLHIKFRRNRPIGSGEDYYKFAWRPAWSCDADQLI